jgi:hypothetical protein
MYWSIFDLTTSILRHNIIGQIRILKVPPEKINIDIQIIFAANRIF